MVTTKEALSILQTRGVEVSYSNLALWVRSGKFQGAKLEDNPRGAVWLIPVDAIVKFEPPKKGRPAKRAAKKAAKK